MTELGIEPRSVTANSILLNHFNKLPIFEWNQEITFSGMEDVLKNIRVRVQKEKAETGVVFSFLRCENIWEQSAERFSLEFSIFLN